MARNISSSKTILAAVSLVFICLPSTKNLFTLSCLVSLYLYPFLVECICPLYFPERSGDVLRAGAQVSLVLSTLGEFFVVVLCCCVDCRHERVAETCES